MNLPTEYLSPDDFEKFANEIARIKFGKEIHDFGEGPDDGIDGLDDTINPTIVIQSKRLNQRTRPSNVLNKIKEEISKINRTSEKYNWQSIFQYVFITSTSLNPNTRKEIRDLNVNYIISEDNIIDGEDLKYLSTQEQYIDIFKNYGLVKKDLIDQIRFNNRKTIHSESHQYIKDFDLTYYAETFNLKRAYETLESNRIVFLIGEPGVGKSTTCNVLGKLFSNRKDARFNVIERDIGEIQSIIDLYHNNFKDSEEKLLVIFDDFLGRNTFDRNDSELNKLKRFLPLTETTENIYLIFNTRTQIINKATASNIDFESIINKRSEQKVTINMSNYSNEDKALILRKRFEEHYNRFNDKDKAILKNKYSELQIRRKYNDIINHNNFNPRLVDHIISNTLTSNNDYLEDFVNTLNSPRSLYDELFEKLTNEAKYFLISLTMFDNQPVDLSESKRAYDFLNLDSTSDINFILKELDDSWVKFIITDDNLENKYIDFSNPSVHDYMNNKIENLGYMRKKVVNHTLYLKQLVMYPGVDFIYKKLNSNYECFEDYKEFTGEKLMSIILKDTITEDDKTIFSNILLDFKGYFYQFEDKEKPTGNWLRIINQIALHSNEYFKKTFITELVFGNNNELLLSNILNNIERDIDEITELINELMYDIFGNYLEQNELIDMGEEQTGVNIFQSILSYKIDLVQSQIDNLEDIDFYIDDTLESPGYLENPLHIPEEDIDTISYEIVDELKDEIYKDIDISAYFSKVSIEFDILDFSNMENYVYDYILNYQENHRDEYENGSTKIEEIHPINQIDEILNKPLE